MENGVRTLGLLLMAGALLAGCGDPDPPPRSAHEVHFDTVDGTIHVHNEGDGLWTDEDRWRPRTDWEPGELSGPISLAWDPAGYLWIADFGLLRYTIFDPDGEFDRVLRRPIARTAPNLYQIGYFDRSGNFVDETVVSDEMGGEGGISFVRVSPGGEVVDTLPPVIRPTYVSPETATQIFLKQTNLGELNWYRPRINWDFGLDDTVWFTTSDPFRTIQRTLEGDTLRIITIDDRSEELTPEDEDRVAEVLSDPALDRGDFNLVRRIARGLHVMGDGHLLVQVEELPGEDGSIFDVFDPEGRLLGTIDLGFPVPIQARFGSLGNTLAIPSFDSIDVPRLVRITLEKK
ncbi:MAG: hypothetical protein EA351_13540 [Gemmatimonadales bacterium]|nr:MAG: hypothetical protein EA351_13540 [Gemmatimonadales bacterium]